MDNKDLYRSSDDRKLEAKANTLLRGVGIRKKTRRAKKKYVKINGERVLKKKYDPVWQKKVEEDMRIHQQQKKERAQMFRDFKRLISDDV